jgi:pyruvate formate lyase activating enzyme
MRRRKKKKVEPIEAFFWEIEPRKRAIRCYACGRECLIKRNEVGYCRVRQNPGKKLVTLNFGKFISIGKQKVENLPLYNFLPNSYVLTLASIGNNIKGKIGFREGYEKLLEKCGNYTPDKIIMRARKENVQGIAFMGSRESEPFIYPEFAFRCSRLALRSNIKPIYVTNGFASQEAIKKLSKYMSAVLVVIYAFADEKFYKNFAEFKKVEMIYDTILQLRKQRVFLEIANFVIPQIGDDIEKCSQLTSWIVDELGSHVPFHLLQFYSEEFAELPATPMETLERCANEAKKTGLRYVYISNFPHSLNNTYCYNCIQPVIVREVSEVKRINLIGDRCPNCGFRIDVKLD